MEIGHINLAKSFNGTGEHFVALVEALDRQGARQHVIVRNQSLARRIAVYDSVTMGPITASPVMAYCLMPNVDVVHVHDDKSAQSGLLLTLTRSIPYVLTQRVVNDASRNPLAHSIDDRAASLICCTDDAARNANRGTASRQINVIPDIAREEDLDFEMLCNKAAAEHLRVYRRAADTFRVPALML